MNMRLPRGFSSPSNGRVSFLNIQLVRSQGEFLITGFAVCFVFSRDYNDLPKSKRLEDHLTKLSQKRSMYTNCSLTRAEISLEIKFGFLKYDFYYLWSQSTVGIRIRL